MLKAALRAGLALAVIVGSIELTQGLASATTQYTTATAVVATPSSSVVAGTTTVQFTATVTGSGGTGTLPSPSGTVTFTGVTGASCANVALHTLGAGTGKATCVLTKANAKAATYHVTAHYAGTGTFATSTSSTVTATVTKDSTTATLSSTRGSPYTAGEPVTYTARITAGTSVTALTPAGTVTFKDTGTTVCTKATPATHSGGASTYTCTESAAAMTAGAHHLTATYGGNGTFSSSAASLTQTATAQGTSIAVTAASPASPSPYGEPVTYTATLTYTAVTAGTPTGKVKFTDASSGWTCTGALSGSTATCTEPATKLTRGTHAVTARYNGTGSNHYYAASTSSGVSQEVTTAAVTVTLTRSVGTTIGVGTPSTWTAVVKATRTPTRETVAPAGTLDFSGLPGSFSCTALPVTQNSPSTGKSTATCGTLRLPAGTYHAKATFTTSTAAYASGTSTQVTLTVTQGATTTAITPTSTSKAGVPVTYTAKVTGVTGFAPTGHVKIADSAQPSWAGCTVAPQSSAGDVSTYTCTEPGRYLTAGPHSVTATFAGDANFTASSATATQTVAKNTTSISITPAGSPTYAGVAQTWAVTVTGGSSSSVSPSGTVTLEDTVGGTTVWTCTENLTVGTTGFSTSAGTCTETAALLTTTAHHLTVTYAGDANFTAAPTGSATPTITRDTIQITVTGPTSSALGAAATYTVSVHGLNSGSCDAFVGA